LGTTEIVMGWVERWRSWRRRRALRRRAARELDALFRERIELLRAGRLRPHHRSRVHLLEVDPAPDGTPARIRFGIIRHPRPHPLAQRGEEVLEILEYRPAADTLRLLASRNLTRRPLDRR